MLGTWASDLSTASSALEERGVQAFVLSASLGSTGGLTGWILAKHAVAATPAKRACGSAVADETVTLTVGKDEAIVLFESLVDFHEGPAIPIHGNADRMAFSRLGGVLESTLVEPFMPEYLTIVAEARKRLVEQSGSFEDD